MYGLEPARDTVNVLIKEGARSTWRVDRPFEGDDAESQAISYAKGRAKLRRPGSAFPKFCVNRVRY